MQEIFMDIPIEKLKQVLGRLGENETNLIWFFSGFPICYFVHIDQFHSMQSSILPEILFEI